MELNLLLKAGVTHAHSMDIIISLLLHRTLRGDAVTGGQSPPTTFFSSRGHTYL